MSSSTTPLPAESSHRRSASRNNPPSRPTTPIRPTSRTSFHGSASAAHTPSRPQPYASSLNANATPLESLEPAFAELSDSMADLEANFMHLQLMHESLARFSESFAAFLYGLNMNAFCVDFPEAPLPESFKRQRLQEQAREAVARMSMGGAGVSSSRARGGGGLESGNEADTEATFM
ncbi:DASH complex subunit Dam1 [Macrophomina phaseolina MS6]|uniref:DASH complex subunit DAM1 n=1 Tax=Macrophomina phaseolina (strain MS6) TaxID=1126212 RepID=K2S1M9_MACPH|nr:DASH complex subunit Dam1 [Macrophomina phaseolina MS6]